MDFTQARDPVFEELISSGILPEEKVNQVERLRDESIQDSLQKMEGRQFEIDFASYQLTCRNLTNGENIFSVVLPQDPKLNFDKDNWESASTHWTLFNEESCKKEADLTPWELQSKLGFIDSTQGTFIDTGDLLTNPYLGLTNHMIYSGYPKNKLLTLPLEIFWSRHNKFLCVSDRGAGTIHILNMSDGHLLKSINIRSSEGIKTLNIAISEIHNQLYACDNSAHLSVVSLTDFSISKISPGAGLLGNLALTHDEQSLYILAIKPKPGLKVIDIQSGEITKEIEIKGDIYSTNSDAPCDLMSISPNGENLLLMTYINNPKPFTPVISVIQISKQKTTQRYSIKDDSRPTMLLFAADNPIAKCNRNLIDMLVEMGELTEEQVRDARLSQRQKALDAQMQEEESSIRVGQAIDLEQRAFEEMEKEKEGGDEEEAEEEDTFKPQKAEQRNISPAADDLIVKQGSDQFYQQTEIDLTGDPKYSDGFERLKRAATKARNEMEWYNGSIIKLKDLAEGHDLEFVIMRDGIEDMLHRHERDSLVKAGLKTVPANCPNCTRPLLGSYICANCGYEIEKPEELLRRGIISIATVGPADNLPLGHVILIDIEGKRIMEIDNQRHVVWALGKGMLTGEVEIEMVFPRDAVRLATRNTLITDFSANRVVEMTPRGRRFWEFNTDFSPEHQLLNPVRATANGLNHIMIVDQGHHRIIEVDREHDILWQYGENGKAGIDAGFLNMPTDIQRMVNGNILITDTGNHRIIELEDNKIVWQYGNAENEESGGYGSEAGQLCYPQSALRMDNGNTLVVDAGNLRVVEINKDKKVIWEYKTNSGPEEHQMDSPFRAAKMPNGMVMVLGENTVIEIHQGQNEVVWHCRLADFQRKKENLKPQHELKRARIKHGVQNPYMRTKEKTDADGSQKKSADISDKMRAILEKRLSTRKSDPGKAHVSVYNNAQLGPLDFFLVDRTRNRIVRTQRDGNISWKFGEKPEQRLQKPHTCTLTPDKTLLIADTDQHRIIDVSPEDGTIVWQYGKTGHSGSEDGCLNRPRSAQRLSNGHTLIADQNNSRIIEVAIDGSLVWEFAGWENVHAPYYAERLENGNTLLIDWSSHVTLEINPQGETIWQFGEKKVSGSDHHHLTYPEHATRLPNGHTLIVDTRNARVLEVNPNGNVVWEFAGDSAVRLSGPTYARRMPDDHTLIVHSSNRQMIEVDSQSLVLWKYMLPFERTGSPSRIQS